MVWSPSKRLNAGSLAPLMKIVGMPVTPKLSARLRSSRIFLATSTFLMQSLKEFGTVRQSERGIVLTLPESYWSGLRVSSFSASSNAKMNGLANILANSSDYKLVVEAHTDNQGKVDELQNLTQERAQAVIDKLLNVGVSENRVEAKGFGASIPVAPNTTNANRGKNRRTELILIPMAN